jgi:dTDP-D-glucose 4,6-dehydratase
VNGTFVLLEAATRQWSRLRGERRDRFRFIHVSTDEVFGSLGETGCFDEASRYAPNSPYAASKAASDHFARAWHHTTVFLSSSPTARTTTGLDLAKMICALLDARSPRSDGKSYAQQITFVSDRPGHDFRYAIDPSHAEAALGWAAKERLEQGLAATIDWYLANSDWLIPVSKLGRLGTRRADTTATPPRPALPRSSRQAPG